MRKKLLITCLLLAGIGSLAGGGYYTWLHTPPAMPDTVEGALAILGSPRYARMSDAEKQRYLDRLRELSDDLPADRRREVYREAMGDEATRNAMREAMAAMIVQRARDYVSATPAEREKMLDQTEAMFDRMSSRPRREPTATDDPDRAARRASRRRFIQERLEQGNPQEQAYIREYFNAMRERRDRQGG